jgi:hypothetical protein
MSSPAWHAIEAEFDLLTAGRRAGAIAIVGGAESTSSQFTATLAGQAASRGIGWLDIGLVGGLPIATQLGRPVHDLILALQSKRPGLPIFGEALAESAAFVEMWKLVMWPRTGDMPSRLGAELERDIRNLSQSLVAVLDATRAQLLIHLDGMSDLSTYGRELLATFTARRGTSSSMLVTTLYPGTPIPAGFTAVSLNALDAADVRVALGDVSGAIVERVLTLCDGHRWFLHELVRRRSELASPPFATLTQREAELELIEFWTYLTRTNFQPMAHTIDSTERRILLAIASHGDGSLDQEQLIRAVGDTDRFDPSSSFLSDHLAALVERQILCIDGDGRLHAAKPGLATYLRRT